MRRSHPKFGFNPDEIEDLSQLKQFCMSYNFGIGSLILQCSITINSETTSALAHIVNLSDWLSTYFVRTGVVRDSILKCFVSKTVSKNTVDYEC